MADGRVAMVRGVGHWVTIQSQFSQTSTLRQTRHVRETENRRFTLWVWSAIMTGSEWFVSYIPLDEIVAEEESLETWQLVYVILQ